MVGVSEKAERFYIVLPFLISQMVYRSFDLGFLTCDFIDSSHAPKSLKFYLASFKVKPLLAYENIFAIHPSSSPYLDKGL